MLRVGQSTVVHIPQWLMAAARGDRQEALGHRCRMWRTAGYVREAMRQVSPRWLSQEGFFSSLEFRKERTTLGAKQLVASMASEEFQPCQITVALCTYNRADMLRQTLETLVALRTNDLFEYELLIVDDGSTDSTPEVIQEFAEKSPVPVRYVRQEGQGVAHARNRCVREAHGSWIAMFDDDQLADPDWLLALFDLAKQRGVRCVGGSRLLNLDPEVIASLPFTNRAVLGEMVASDEPHRIGNKPLFAGGTVLIERSVFDEIGMFDEKLLYGGEDLDLFRRMQAAGIEAWYAPRSICRHLIPPYRLDAKYMLWSSLRTGECFGHRDAEEWGRFKTFGAAMLRLMQSTVLHVPLWLQAAARGKKQHALGYRCRVWRTAGYVREALRQISPRWLSQEGFFSSLEFRKERTTLGASELTASKTS